MRPANFWRAFSTEQPTASYRAGAAAGAVCSGGLKFTFGAVRAPSSALKYASFLAKPDMPAMTLLGNS